MLEFLSGKITSIVTCHMVDYDLPEIKGKNCCLRWICPTDHRPKNARVVFGGKNVDCHLLSTSEMNRAATERAATITVHGC